jgi:hypothetical protein
MKNEEERVQIPTSRRGFVRRCLGTGAALAAAPTGHARATNAVNDRRPLGMATPNLAEYERILSRTDRMDVLGRPRSWSLVTQGFHPFSPERIVVIPPGGSSGVRYGDRCGWRLRRRIDQRIDRKIVEQDEVIKRSHPGYEPVGGRFPESERESFYWIMDVMSGHYGVRSQFEAWVVGLAGREVLGSSAGNGCGMAHQYQHGGGVPVDCPPVDWWLFLFPGGIDWSAWDGEEIFAVIAHVARDDEYSHAGNRMLPTWSLTAAVQSAVKGDWGRIARMGRIEVAWHLNPITARLLDELYG